MYKLHRGEKVIPSETAGAGGGNYQVTIINQLSKDLVNELINPNTIINVINADILNDGITRRVVKGVV